MSRGFCIAPRASRAGLPFQAYLAAGFGLWLGSQAFVNIGVNMGVLPTKGLTLPLMSYGALEHDRHARVARPAAARLPRDVQRAAGERAACDARRLRAMSAPRRS